MSLADIHSSLLAKDRANSPTAAEMLRQHYDLPALAELNKRFVDKILKAVSQELVFLGIRTVETIRWLKKIVCLKFGTRMLSRYDTYQY